MVSDLIRRFVEAGRRAWPGVGVSPQVLAQHLAHLQSRDGQPPTERFHRAADLYLACACAQGSARALAAFDAHFLSNVDSFVARFDISPQFAAEVRQELRVRLLMAAPGAHPRIAEYSGRGPLGAWVRMAAVRLAIDLKRALRAPIEGPLPDAGETNDPELQLLKNRYTAEYQSALRAAWQRLSVHARRLLCLHYLDGRNLDEVGRMYRVARATAYRWIVAARESVLDSMMRTLRERLRLSRAEFDSIGRVVSEDLHVGWSAYAVSNTSSNPGRRRASDSRSSKHSRDPAPRRV
jgi:RNA polymerase sigma-70 factor (ECF subfamily)